jgi:hypothetical protein
MFFDEIAPDTSIYMVSGYSIFFLIVLVYVASLFIRKRNLEQDLMTLESLQEERPAPAPAKPAPIRRKPARAKTTKAKQPPRKVPRKR